VTFFDHPWSLIMVNCQYFGVDSRFQMFRERRMTLILSRRKANSVARDVAGMLLVVANRCSGFEHTKWDCFDSKQVSDD
jgi:hypothetical protein